jgi:hypothetical protein
MDLLSIRPDSIEVPINHPGTRKPLGLVLKCVSLEDERVKAIERVMKNKALRAGRNSMSAEKMDENTLALLCATVVGWTWPEELTLGDLAKPDATPENVRKLLSINWIAKQLDDALGDDSAFFTKSALNSAPS